MEKRGQLVTLTKKPKKATIIEGFPANFTKFDQKLRKAFR